MKKITYAFCFLIYFSVLTLIPPSAILSGVWHLAELSPGWLCTELIKLRFKELLPARHWRKHSCKYSHLTEKIIYSLCIDHVKKGVHFTTPLEKIDNIIIFHESGNLLLQDVSEGNEKNKNLRCHYENIQPKYWFIYVKYSWFWLSGFAKNNDFC